MAWLAMNRQLYPWWGHHTQLQATTMDATGEKCGGIFVACDTEPITALTFLAGATITTSKAVKVGIQSVGADGLPTGTWLGAAAAGYGVVPALVADTFYEVTLGASVTPIIGTQYAVVIEWDNDADPGTIQIRHKVGLGNVGLQYNPVNGNYAVAKTSATWTKDGSQLLGMFALSRGGVYYPIDGLGVPGKYTLLTLTTTNDPDEVGNRIVIPFKARCVGLYAFIDLDEPMQFNLYPESGAALATQNTHNVSAPPRSISSSSLAIAPLDTPVTIEADTVYRPSIKPTTGNVAGVTKMDFPSAAALGQLPGGTNYYACERADGGAWTDTATRRYPVGLILDAVDSGSAAAAAAFSYPLRRMG